MNKDEIEIIEIDDYEIEIIEIEDETPIKNLKEYKINNSIIDKIRKKLTKKTAAIITICSVTLLITLSNVFVINKNMEWKNQSNIVYTNINDNIEFELNNKEYNTILVNEKYEEYGAKLIINGEEKNEEITIEKSNLDTTKVGTYHVIYTYPINMNQTKILYRTINVVDTEKPVIKILGPNVYTMLIDEEYKEPGIVITDNSNENLTDKVEIENNINTNKPGTYEIKYKVKDSSGNETTARRIVEVKKSYQINTNTITYNSFTEKGVFIKGMVQNKNYTNKMLLKNKDTGNELIVDTSTKNHYYQLSLNVTNLENGTYEFYLINDTLEPLANNLNNYQKIIRAHINNKLVTMEYEKSKVNMKIETFEYLYDVVIDPGHGGDDTGATNGKYIEKNINLEQSIYEKQRYEQHGLKVFHTSNL